MIRKDIGVLIKQAETQGWTVEYTKKNHYKWTAPNGVFFFSGSTPSDHRSMKALKRDLRVNGFVEIIGKKSRGR